MASQLPFLPVLFSPWWSRSHSRSLTTGNYIISIAGCAAPFISADWFIEEQIDSPQLLQHNDNARLVALQLGNAYGLLFMLGVAVLYTTTELKVVRNYL
ncbi:hypothetical protein PG997_009595 [Apiospora hydei]|uniref:DUF7704 domain-containing protein n=1 Tax=Apiospora hydei TaxID=1337664 RepID=A0ABR1VVS2_9PEZI